MAENPLGKLGDFFQILFAAPGIRGILGIQGIQTAVALVGNPTLSQAVHGTAATAEMDLPSGGGPSNTEAALRDLKERVDRVHRASALPVRCGVAPLPAELPDGSLQSSVARHDLQHQGIVEQMRGGGLLSPELTFIDFGAGGGGLRLHHHHHHHQRVESDAGVELDRRRRLPSEQRAY